MLLELQAEHATQPQSGEFRLRRVTASGWGGGRGGEECFGEHLLCTYAPLSALSWPYLTFTAVLFDSTAIYPYYTEEETGAQRG